jgi:hypothetical protein
MPFDDRELDVASLIISFCGAKLGGNKAGAGRTSSLNIKQSSPNKWVCQ